MDLVTFAVSCSGSDICIYLFFVLWKLFSNFDCIDIAANDGTIQPTTTTKQNKTKISPTLGHVPTQHCELVRRRTTGPVAPALSRLEDDRLLRPDGIGTRIEYSGTRNHGNLLAAIQGGRKGRIVDHQQPHPDQRKILARNPRADSERESRRICTLCVSWFVFDVKILCNRYPLAFIYSFIDAQNSLFCSLAYAACHGDCPVDRRPRKTSRNP